MRAAVISRFLMKPYRYSEVPGFCTEFLRYGWYRQVARRVREKDKMWKNRARPTWIEPFETKEKRHGGR